MREQHWIKQLNPYYNTHKAYQTIDERKEQIKQYKQQYYQTHTDEIKQQAKKYYQTHADEKKQYYQTHADEIKQRHQQHKSDCKCEACGFIGDKSGYNRHCKSKKHIAMSN